MTESPDLQSDSQHEPNAFHAFQEKVKGTNINEQTLIATDYLNHFNEIVMMLEMIPDMPECLDEAKEWRPKSYHDHFRDSSFSDKELAVAAYEHSPARYREPFEETVSKMNRLVVASLDRIEARLPNNDPDATAHAASRAARRLQKLIDVASAIIHGDEPTVDQEEIDELLEG